MLKQIDVPEETYFKALLKFGQNQAGILRDLAVSFSSPFAPSTALPAEEAAALFADVTHKAVNMLQDADILKHLTKEDECMLVFDSLVQDFALKDHNLHCEDFKAHCSKHGLVGNENFQQELSEIVAKLELLNH